MEIEAECSKYVKEYYSYANGIAYEVVDLKCFFPNILQRH
jgi:hypothetical protein